MERDARIYVAGHRGLVGSALVRALEAGGYSNLLLAPRDELDLTDAAATRRWFETNRPEHVFLAAAKVGGILANNTYPADFIRINLQIQTNTIESAHASGVKKLLFLGSSCIYPRLAAQPMTEAALLTGPLEPTNAPYAIAKIAGLALCESYNRQFGTKYIAAMPTNLYGPDDNFDLETSHVLPAMIRRFHEAKETGRPEVVLWGTGSPRREFLFVDDLADGLVFLMQKLDPDRDGYLINVGVGQDLSIRELAELIAGIVGYQGTMRWDTEKPDGTPRKLLDTSKMEALGWRATHSLRSGIERTYRAFLEGRGRRG